VLLSVYSLVGHWARRHFFAIREGRCYNVLREASGNGSNPWAAATLTSLSRMPGWNLPARRYHMRPKLIIAVLAVMLVGSCSRPTPSEQNPAWVRDLIAKYASEPVGNPPQSIWRYKFEGQTVYYIPPQCCDQMGILYDATGEILCYPDGGLAGKGDGRCPDFRTMRSNEELIWRDPRTR
jgi:hypothetical protein